MSGRNSPAKNLIVFLCHGSEDKAAVREIYARLRQDGVRPWLDEEEILPGQDWDAEILRAVRRSHAILVCLSSGSVRKEGYLQKELRLALDAADEKPDGTIFIIPVKFDDCELPERLRHWQWVDWRDDDAYARILRSLRARADECGVENLPGEGPLTHVIKPVDGTSGRILYKTADVRALLQRFYRGELSAYDIQPLPSGHVAAITDEALSDVLNSHDSDQRRAVEKGKLLALIGIRPPYREWLEATTKNHCFRNDVDEEGAPDTVISPEIKRIPVRSSNIASIGYDARSEVLEVAFHSGSIYRYFDIPEYLYDGIMSAPSHGKYLDIHIKKAGYPYERIK
jgi:hypothetical protein